METRSVYLALMQIKNTASPLKKEAIIRENRNELFERILVAAYDPFQRYYIQRVPKQRTTGTLKFNEDVFKLLKLLSSRRLSGNKAKAVIEKFINHMTFEAASIFRRVLRKDLRCGIGITTINNAIPGLVDSFDVMLAEQINWDRAYWPCYISRKVDGVRGYKRGNKLLTRKGHTLRGLDHLIEEMLDRGMGDVDGEIEVPGELFDDSSGLIRNMDPIPNAIYRPFDLPTLDAPFYARYTALEGYTFLSENLKTISHELVNNKEEAMAKYKKVPERRV
jgi:hypothetical protein